MAQRQVTALTEKISEAEGLVAVAAAKGAMATQKEKKKAKGLTEKLPKLRADLISAKSELQNKKAQADAAAALEQAKAAARTEKEEATRAMTEAGLMLFVSTRIGLQDRFDNSSDTALACWQAVVTKYKAAARRDELPESDYNRGVEAFKKIWSKACEAVVGEGAARHLAQRRARRGGRGEGR